VLPGYACSGGSAIGPSVCIEVCGNLIMTPNEDCEDGNTASLDGCSSSCHFESGWTCSIVNLRSVCLPICGDGLRVAAEVCDDGVSIQDYKGCKVDC